MQCLYPSVVGNVHILTISTHPHPHVHTHLHNVLCLNQVKSHVFHQWCDESLEIWAWERIQVKGNQCQGVRKPSIGSLPLLSPTSSSFSSSSSLLFLSPSSPSSLSLSSFLPHLSLLFSSSLSSSLPLLPLPSPTTTPSSPSGVVFCSPHAKAALTFTISSTFASLVSTR